MHRIENSDQSASKFIESGLQRDVTASVVVFLVALPLCLGIALASEASLYSGLLAGIIGGIVVGAVSGSHTSVSGPAAGLAAIVAAPIAALGSFEAFLMAVFVAAVTIAIVASLETLLNLEAVDKLDPERRDSPPSRELIAQGVGNTLAGLIGGLPVTSVIVRSSINVGVGAKTKLSAILHGVLLVVCVAIFPIYLNMIPLAALAAILLVTGFKLASPTLFRQMWSEGHYQFIPFVVTLVSIVFTDLLIGILIGLGVSVLFILNSNLRRPVRRIVETHIGGDVLHVELANQAF